MKTVFAFDIGDEFHLRSGGISNVFPTFGSLFSTILFNVYVLAGIVFVFLLIFGGFSVIIGAGSKDASKLEKGQKAITAAVIGFVVIFASYFIIQIIEVLTGVYILEPSLNPGF